ncbi:DUF3093 family protein [Tamaricihabitans halophyticus]|uniref:DUF3093 family protein n=1 Tax=Tamaricihabitans halophyticus TaxID=1262583 RepID=A0A4R2QT66_9PSEU|nr:DUF3093 family protein [Tamaricihabitans halophyticus]TCP53110.1 DUF3093 family protein [Tamaricihabitans halophyticus]
MLVDDEQPAVYAEPGSSWWPLVWPPLFVALGVGAEALTGRVHTFAWVLAGIALFAGCAVWINARRRFLRVRLTARTLRQGGESLPVERITAVSEVGTPVGARVLGGGIAVPRKYTGVPIELDDGSVVLAWARDGVSLQAALRSLVEP